MAKSTKSFTSVSPTQKQVKQKDKLVMGHSIKIFLNKSKIRKDGLCPVYLRCTINRIKFEVSLSLYGNENTFDETSGLFRGKKQTDANLIIEGEKAKLTDIITRMRLARKSLSAKKVKDLYTKTCSDEDFIEFMERFAEAKYLKDEITEGRKKRYTVIANKLRAFTDRGKLPFSDISKEFIEEFSANEKRYLSKLAKEQGRGTTNTLNTIATGLKIIKSVCSEAVRQNLLLENPFNEVKIRTVKVEKPSLTVTEVKRLIKLQQSKSLNPMLKESLEQFLFAIFTGIRFSDLKIIGKNNIKDGMLSFIAKKTKRHGSKARVPLLPICMKIIEGRESPFFPKYENQPFNRNLKIIAEMAKIETQMTAHTARHTFISMYLRAGGKIDVAQQFTALTNIKQVMDYNQVFDEQLISEIKKVETLIK